jgi:hypothetical protein
MNIYKLTFTDSAEADTILIAKNVMDPESNYINGTHAIVYLGIINEQYCVDVMTTDEIDFGTNVIEPNNPMHQFAGY